MKIVIVGGGTAGWLAALMIKKIQGTSHDVTVIESSKIGIVGAGEGSTGYLTDIIQGNTWDYGCNEADFFKETGATVKLGIKHKEWRELGHEYIAPIDAPAVNGVGTDYLSMYAILNDIPLHLASDNGKFIEDSLSSFTMLGDVIDNTKGHAYHFDAHLVGKYFKKVCGSEVTHIDSEVTEVNLSKNDEIKSLSLSNGQIVEADFFIDASGFAKVLSNKLGIEWKSYSKHLPVNTAMPFILPFEEDEKIDPLTTAWALSSGWMWMIPTQERYGCGYVFDDRFISHEEAQKEVETKLGKKIEPIRFLKFDTGRLETFWNGNCLSIGLAAAFAEPLEATSIHSTILQLNSFIFDYLKDSKEQTINTGMINIYNRKISKMYDDFRDFLVIHYMGKRDDSEFWRWITTGETLTDQAKDIIEMQKSKIVHPKDMDQYFGYAGAGLYNWVLAGLGYIGKEEAKRELDFYNQYDIAQTVWKINEGAFESAKSVIIDNTEFIKNVGVWADGNSFSK
jgi:tryptophan halogenase